MKNSLLCFSFLFLCLSVHAQVDMKKLESSVKIDIKSYTAYTVCDIGTFIEKYNCRNEFANHGYTDRRLHVSALTADKLTGDAANCFERQATELIKASKILKKEKHRDSNLNFRFHVVREDHARTLKKILVEKTSQDPSVKTCNGESDCIEASYWAETKSCKINYAEDIVSTLCSNH